MIWLSWIDDCVCFVNAEDVEDPHNRMKRLFDCEDVENVEYYVGFKVDRK